MKNIWIDETDKRTTLRLAKFIGILIALVAALSLFWAIAAPSANATTTCYPASECGTSQPAPSGNSGYPAAPGANNGDNYEGLICIGAGLITAAAALGAGAVSGGIGTGVVASAAGGGVGTSTNCYYMQALTG